MSYHVKCGFVCFVFNYVLYFKYFIFNYNSYLNIVSFKNCLMSYLCLNVCSHFNIVSLFSNCHLNVISYFICFMLILYCSLCLGTASCVTFFRSNICPR